jgi:hypothetical protein
VQVHEHELEQLCDGEGDSKGLIWALHVRERLPLDILKALPGALKAVSKRDGGSSSSSQRRRGAAAEDAAGVWGGAVGSVLAATAACVLVEKCYRACC